MEKITEHEANIIKVKKKEYKKDGACCMSREQKCMYQGSSLETLNERDYAEPRKYMEGYQHN